MSTTMSRVPGHDVIPEWIVAKRERWVRNTTIAARRRSLTIARATARSWKCHGLDRSHREARTAECLTSCQARQQSDEEDHP